MMEAHVERLIGARVRDCDGVSVGRLEEMKVEIIDGEPVVTEFHIGTGAAIERIAGFVRQLPFFSSLPFHPTEFLVPWTIVDLTDPSHPRLTVGKAELRPVRRAVGHPDYFSFR
jgi:sporulation protein YlmC with PRC-barrel domain